jgi:hypothetical protein
MAQFYFAFSDDPESPAGAEALEYPSVDHAVEAGLEVLADIATKAREPGETHVYMRITGDGGLVAKVSMEIRIDLHE